MARYTTAAVHFFFCVCVSFSFTTLASQTKVKRNKNRKKKNVLCIYIVVVRWPREIYSPQTNETMARLISFFFKKKIVNKI
jgi:hypothetical protein